MTTTATVASRRCSVYICLPQRDMPSSSPESASSSLESRAAHRSVNRKDPVAGPTTSPCRRAEARSTRQKKTVPSGVTDVDASCSTVATVPSMTGLRRKCVLVAGISTGAVATRSSS